MADAVKVVGWIIAGAVGVHLLTSVAFGGNVSSILDSFNGTIRAMLGQG